MQVLFLQDVKSVARRGDVKNVKDGYFRNFLMPNKIAVVATPDKIKQSEEMKKKMLIQKDRLVEQAEEVKKRLEGLEVSIITKVDGKKLYGSIAEKEVIKAIESESKIKLDKSNIKMDEHIKTVGTHNIKVVITEGVEVSIKLVVKGE